MDEYRPAVVQDFKPSFALGEKGRFLIVYIKTDNFDEFKRFLPFIDWNGNFEEGYPMTTIFSCALDRKHDVVRTLLKMGFAQEEPRIMASF
jgi:hypothetical protein